MEGEKMNISEVTETVVRQIIKSGRDARVVIHEDKPYGRCVEISGFVPDKHEEADDNGIPDGDIACDYCKYSDLFEDEYPCSKCKYNALDYFERRNDEETD